MPASYSYDLRQRVMAAYQQKEGSMRQLAERFKLHFTTVRNWVKQSKTDSSLTPKTFSNGRRSMIQAEHKAFLENLYRQQPDLTHVEAGERFMTQFGRHPSVWVMSRAHKRLGISRKKNVL